MVDIPYTDHKTNELEMQSSEMTQSTIIQLIVAIYVLHNIDNYTQNPGR